jgi:hypothetical protein
MGTCIVCGNEDARSFDILWEGGIMTFDSFECAIHRLAPNCRHCDCRIIGHGVEAQGALFCCVHCARQAIVRGAEDEPPARGRFIHRTGNNNAGVRREVILFVPLRTSASSVPLR